MKYQIIIPNWEYKYVRTKSTIPKYWLSKDSNKLPKKYKEVLDPNKAVFKNGKFYCCDQNQNRFLKNTLKVGKENSLKLNGQSLYNAMLNWRERSKLAEYYHKYFSSYIKEQIKPIKFEVGKDFFSISCDIYEIKRSSMPDVSNMWLLEKFFEDSLQECGIIPNDSPDYVIESGRKRYHWVNKEEDRKLIFNIDIIQ